MAQGRCARRPWKLLLLPRLHRSFLRCAHSLTAQAARDQADHQPIVEVTKDEVQQQRLENYVLRDDEDLQTISVWWKGFANDEFVEVQFPHEQHSLAGR